MKILVCGAGYVGSANALMLSSKNEVFMYDINKGKISAVKRKDFSYLNEDNIEDLPICKSNVKIIEKLDNINFDYTIIALPTDIKRNGKLDVTGIIEFLKNFRSLNIKSRIIVKSTLPIGGSEIIKSEVGNFLYMPEFLREGKAVHDCFYPSRIIVGGHLDYAPEAIYLYNDCTLNKTNILKVSHLEAECIKLFSNTYLAMRVAFFNELDTFMLKNNVRSDVVINGMGFDSRIGDFYNNPSFGYGGYCLPKDTEEVISTIDSILIAKINDSNQNRINEIIEYIIKKGYKNIGVYKLGAKSESNRVNNSATLKILSVLKKHKKNIYFYDLDNNNIDAYKSVDTIEELFKLSDIVLANRMDNDIEKYRNLIFTRDIFSIN